MRHALLAHAGALIVPSPYESLSIVLLEAWNHATPALVNAYCKVLQGQVRRASGGLYYRSSREFQEALSWLLGNEQRNTGLAGHNRHVNSELVDGESVRRVFSVIQPKRNRFTGADVDLLLVEFETTCAQRRQLRQHTGADGLR